jgi:hypothetical protein
MSWASIANNQCVSLNNLQDAVNNGVFTLKNTIPVSNKQTNKSEAEFYVNIDPISKANNELVVKSNLVANTSTTTTSTTIPPVSPQYAIAGTGNSIYTSNNNGGNWSVSYITGSGYNTELVEVNSTGQYMLILGLPFSSSLLHIYLSSNYGNSFTFLFATNTTLGTIRAMAMSDNSQYIIFLYSGNAGPIYRSTDFGASFSFSNAIPYSNWKSVAMSSSGQYVTAVSLNNYIWVSSDYGASFTAKTAYPATNWGAVTMSSNGQYQVAGRDTIYRSTNYGSTWTNVGAPVSNGYGALAMSGDGQYLLGLSYFRNLELYRSTNYGANWSIVTTIGSGGSGNWNCVAISPDGVTQLVGANGNVWPTNDMWRSTNSGANFNIVSGTNEGWNSISIGD